MSLLDNYDLTNLKNKSETHVFDELEKQLEKYPPELCRCRDCIGDMAAVALNKVEPKYTWSLLGGMYASSAMDDAAYKAQLRAAVQDAIEIVGKNPLHNT